MTHRPNLQRIRKQNYNKNIFWNIVTTVKPGNTEMPWGQSFIPVSTGSGLERVFVFGEEQTTITCTIDFRVIIQDVSSVGLQNERWMYENKLI